MSMVSTVSMSRPANVLGWRTEPHLTMLRRRVLPLRRSITADFGTHPAMRRSTVDGASGTNAAGGLVTTTRDVSPVRRAER
jgi:hypothetical protein